MTHLCGVVLRCFFDIGAHDIRTGVGLDVLGHGKLMFVGILEMLIADVKALVEAIGANGHTAVLPCFFCKGIVSFDAKANYPLIRDNASFATLDCLDKRMEETHRCQFGK